MADGDHQGRMRAPANEPDWLTLGQAAKYFGVAQSTIRKWSDSGRLPAFYTPGGHRRFRLGDLDAFVGGARGAAPTGSGGGVAGVLIVHDDARLREVVRVNLQMGGYQGREGAS